MRRNSREQGSQGRFERWKKAYSTVAIVAVNTLVLFLAIEGVSWVLLKTRMVAPTGRREGGRAGEEVLRHVYPGWTDQRIQEVRNESIQMLTLAYAPWVQFRHKDFQGKYVTVKDGVRGTDPSTSAVSGSAAVPVHDIYFFGGSTMLGLHVPDSETIPAHFVELAAQRYPGISLRVTNYGAGYYFSAQEFILLTSLLLREDRPPSQVVFLDGLNDVLQPGSSFSQAPFFTPEMAGLFGSASRNPAGRFLDWGKGFHTVELFGALGWTRLGQDYNVDRLRTGLGYSYRMPQGVTETEVAGAIAGNYLRALENTRSLCRARGIRCDFFWQPVPFYDYDRSKDPICSSDDRPLFGKTYPAIRKAAESLPDLVYLNDIQKTEPYPYLDHIHYSSAMMKKLAAAILDNLDLNADGPSGAGAHETGGP